MSAELLKTNVNEHTEKKNNLTYLSWAWAWAEVLKFDPLAVWVVHTYGPQGAEEPCMRIGKTAMVHVSVTIKNLRRECMLPVMDHKNKAIHDPDAFQVNTAIMRCMTKAISMHGLGLYIYAGEDLPEGEEDPRRPPDTSARPTGDGKVLIDKQSNSSASGPVVIAAERETMIQLAASIAANMFKAGEKDAAYDKISEFLPDSEEYLYLHQTLQPNATFRAYIKFRLEAARKAYNQQEETLQ